MDLKKLMQFRFPIIEHTYTAKDTILYALGLGYGADPLSPSEIAFVYEENLKTAPSQCVVLAHPGFWVREPELEIEWAKVLHGEQGFEIHKPIPPHGSVAGRHEIEAVDDKGADKGAVVHQLTRLHDGRRGSRWPPCARSSSCAATAAAVRSARRRRRPPRSPTGRRTGRARSGPCRSRR